MKQSFILDGIETVFRTQEEWDVLNAPASYTPNAEIPNPEDYPEALRAKCANGTFIGQQLESGINAWFGIPFATQPVGELRFKKALPPPDSDKAYEAYHYMHYEYQPRYDGRPYDIKDMMGEDCLGLNIWSNPASDYEKKPVFVYVHGGGWYIGSSSNPLYRGELFTHYNPDILYISVDYRVGMYGQLNASLFADGADYPDACNNGLLDVVESLRWIKKNIAAFGGDPDNITLCGESAGGGCVSMVCALDCVLEEKLVQKAIPMSGNLSQAGRPDSTTKLPELLKEYFNTDSLAYIAGLPANRLADFWLRYGDSFHNCIMQDGNTICEDPYELYKNGKNRDIIFLQGFTGNESKYYQHVFGDSEPLYKLLAKANIEADVQAVKEAGAEVVIAIPHWGTEYQRSPDPDVRKYAARMIAAGVDVIIGGHPHMVQPIEWLTVDSEDGSSRTGLVAWSLGNFVDNMSMRYTDAGIILDFSIVDRGDGTFGVTDVGYVPVYCWRQNSVTQTLCSGDYLDQRPEGMSDSTYARMKESRREIVSLIGDEFKVLDH